MTSRTKRWSFVSGGVATAVLVASIATAQLIGSAWLLLGPSIGIIATCVIFDLAFPIRANCRRGVDLLYGALEGAVVGVPSWLSIMAAVRLWVDVGDKWGLYLVYFSPFSALLGALIGGGVRLSSWKRRNRGFST